MPNFKQAIASNSIGRHSSSLKLQDMKHPEGWYALALHPCRKTLQMVTCQYAMCWLPVTLPHGFCYTKLANLRLLDAAQKGREYAGVVETNK